MVKTIALSMITKNEEKNLPICLENAKRYVGEIIVVDTGSEDNTKEIALNFGAKVYEFTWNGDFSAARNFALSKSTSDWNLVLDADERIVKWDRKFLHHFMDNSHQIGRIKIVSNFIQNGEERQSQDSISRLLPKGVTFTGKIHEQVTSAFTRVDVPIEIFHTGYFDTNKSERNLELLLAELQENEQNPYILYQLARQFKAIKKVEKALFYFDLAYKNMSQKEPYSIDLMVNYIYSLIELKQFHKILEMISQEQHWLKNSPDFHFVCGIFYLNFVMNDPNLNLSYFPFIESSYLKCLSLNGNNEIVLGVSSFLAAYNLAVYYETTGNTAKAREYYLLSASSSYQPAIDRLTRLK